MEYGQMVMLISTVSVTVLIVLFLLLCAVTRLKGDSLFAAFIILTVLIPDYVCTLSIIYNWDKVALIVYPLAISSNLTIMPLMYLLVHKGFNPYYKFKAIHMLHFIPALFSAICAASGHKEFFINGNINYRLGNVMSSGLNYSSVNLILIILQLAIYFIIIFRFMHKVKIYVLSHYTSADMLKKRWIPRFISLVCIMVLISIVSNYILDWETLWLFYFTNAITMGYLILQQFENAMRVKVNLAPSEEYVKNEEIDFIKEAYSQNQPLKEDMDMLILFAKKIQDWLQHSGAYTNPNLSLKEVSFATGISVNNISKAINTILQKNFFELVNGYRIEESKQLLVSKKKLGLTLETIAEKCGFNSQYSFCRAFKKHTGCSTTQWLKHQL